MSPARPRTEFQQLMDELRGVRSDLTKFGDRLTRGEARQDEIVEQAARLAARMETLANDIDAADLRARNARGEILQTQTEAWRLMDKKFEAGSVAFDVTVDSLRQRVDEIAGELAERVAPAMDAGIETASDKVAVKVDARAKPARKILIAGSLLGGGGGIVMILDNLPKAAKALHAAWVGMGAAGTDLIK